MLDIRKNYYVVYHNQSSVCKPWKEFPDNIVIYNNSNSNNNNTDNNDNNNSNDNNCHYFWAYKAVSDKI